MEQALTRITHRLIRIVVISFAITPIVGYSLSIYLGLLDADEFLQSAAIPLGIAYLGLLAGLIIHLRRYTRPFIAWLRDVPKSNTPLPTRLTEQLAAFTNNYWAFFLLYVLLMPTLQHWLGVTSPGLVGTASLVQFMLLQLIIATLVGMPGYLMSLNMLGQLIRYTGLDRVQVSMRAKMMIIGAYVPLLTTGALLKYFWWRTGELPMEMVVAWGLLGLLGITVSVLAIRGMHQALRPLSKLSRAGGASSHTELARHLRPRSNDEFGYLLQTLGRLFHRLGEQDATVRAIVDNAAEGIVVVNAEHEIQMFNPAAERIFGYTAQEIHGKKVAWLLPDLAQRLSDSERLEGKNELEFEYTRRDGEIRTVAVCFSRMILDEQTYFVCLTGDITARKQAQEQLREAEARYRNLVETAHDLVWSMDPEGRWTYLNGAAKAIYGLPPEEMLGRHFSEFQAAESANRDHDAFDRLLAGNELVHYETVHLDARGRPHNISFNARLIHNDNGDISAITGTARDITEQKAFEHELTYQAQHDTLTGLYNRTYFYQELNRVIARVARSGADCALFYIDLDQFKYINDTLGHAAGDQLLQECTAMLKTHIREGDLLARFGGDEFTILLYNVNGTEAINVAENLRNLFERFTFFYTEKNFNVTCSIGVALINNNVHSPDDVLSHADLACNLAKSEGRNRVHLYTAKDPAKAGMAEDMGWAARVREAYEQDRFTLVYQPIMSINDGIIHDYETLLRMKLDNGDVILPGGFMPAAERFGLIHNVDRWTVRNAIQKLAEIHTADAEISFAINLSGRAFEDVGLIQLIKDQLRNHAVAPERITFEITETAAISNLTAAVEFIASLKDLGCQFALDDFGSGFCSFAYLKHLPVDKLKIDGSFIQGLTAGRVDQAMVQSMAHVAHALGKQTIAEFVEDAETLEILRGFGVDFAQGHYVGEPSKDVPVLPMDSGLRMKTEALN